MSSKPEIRPTLFSRASRCRAALGLVGLAILGAPGAQGGALPRLAAPFLAWETGAIPFGIDAGDLDADGRLDLVVANTGESSLSVRLALGDGLFGPQVRIPTADAPWAVAVGDLDGDAALDCVVACYVADSVAVLRGRGDGTFEPRPSLPTPPDPKGVALAALDADPWLDVVTLNSPYNFPPGSLSVWLATGPGTFGVRHDLTAPGKPVAFRAADTNGDGRAELIVAHTDPEGVTILENAGDGTFPQSTTLGLSGTPLGLAVGDWNDDGRPDGAVYIERFELGTLVQRLAVWLGAPDSMVAMPEVFAIGFGSDLASGDLDADGDTDLVAIGSTVNVHLGNGDGTFGFPRPHDAGNEARSGVVGDFDGDGRLDVAVSAAGSWAVAVLPGNGDGSLGVAPMLTASRPQSVACADFDADGALDLVLASPAVDRVAVHRGDGAGGFAAAREFTVPPEPSGVTVADWDEDGALDIAVVTFPNVGVAGRLAVLRGDGSGGFTPAGDWALAGPATLVVSGDWNGDGHADIAAALWTAAWPADGVVETRLGLADGGFAPPVTHAVGPLPMGLATADLDGDSHADLVASFRQSAAVPLGGVTVLRGDGNGGFAARTDYETGPEPRGVALADVDTDGAVDIVVANSNFASPGPGSLAVLRGQGGSDFDPPVAYATGIESFGLLLADLDGDGWLDAATTNAGANTLSVYRGRGDASFESRLDWGTGNRPIAVACGDFDADGRIDLVTANSGAATATVLANRTVQTPVVVSEFTCSACGAARCLAWRLAGAARPSLRGIDVERAADPAGPWTTLTERPLVPAATGSFVDATAPPTPAWYRLRLLAADGSIAYHGPIAAHTAARGPGLWLAPPTPAVDAVHIEYEAGQVAANLWLAIVDVRGRIVRTLVRGGRPAGRHQVAWDRRDARGAPVARGVYWVHLVADGRTATRTLVLGHR